MKPDKMTTLPNIDDLWDYRDPKGTALKFEALLPEATSNPSYYAVLLTQLARTQSLQRNFEKAHTLLDKAEALLTSSMSIATIRYHLERGRTYNSSNKKTIACQHCTTAYRLAIKSRQDFYAVDAAHMLGISEKGDSQLEWNLKALTLIETSSDVKVQKWLGPLSNNIGWYYHEKQEFEQALIYFQKALKGWQYRKDKKGIFIARWTIGRVYRSLNQLKQALQVQMGLLLEIEQGLAQPDGYVYEEIGECLLLQNKKTESKSYFQKAYELLPKDKWLVDNELERLERLKKLGR